MEETLQRRVQEDRIVDASLSRLEQVESLLGVPIDLGVAPDGAAEDPILIRPPQLPPIPQAAGVIGTPIGTLAGVRTERHHRAPPVLHHDTGLGRAPVPTWEDVERVAPVVPVVPEPRWRRLQREDQTRLARAFDERQARRAHTDRTWRHRGRVGEELVTFFEGRR